MAPKISARKANRNRCLDTDNGLVISQRGPPTTATRSKTESYITLTVHNRCHNGVPIPITLHQQQRRSIDADVQKKTLAN